MADEVASSHLAFSRALLYGIHGSFFFFPPRWGFLPSKAKGSHGDRDEGTESNLNCLTLRLGHSSLTEKAGRESQHLAHKQPHGRVNGPSSDAQGCGLSMFGRSVI